MWLRNHKVVEQLVTQMNNFKEAKIYQCAYYYWSQSLMHLSIVIPLYQLYDTLHYFVEPWLFNTRFYSGLSRASHVLTVLTWNDTLLHPVQNVHMQNVTCLVSNDFSKGLWSWSVLLVSWLYFHGARVTLLFIKVASRLQCLLHLPCSKHAGEFPPSLSSPPHIH